MSNIVDHTEVRDIVYHPVKQHFSEKSNLYPDYLKNDYFMIKEKKERVIFSGNKTIVILHDGTKGIASCCPTDPFDKLKGIKIAFLRARIESLQKQLEQLYE